MFDLLYATGGSSKTSRLPGLSVLSTVFERCTASWLSLHMADDMGCDKTLNTTLKNARVVPGAYIDELPLRVTPYRCSSSPPKLSLPGPATSVMSYTEICKSPVQDDRCMSLVKGSPEDPQNDDTSGFTSDESVRFAATSFQDSGILTFFCEFPGRRYSI
jgi:hypothetical protein